MKTSALAVAAALSLGAEAGSLLRRGHAAHHLDKRDYGYPEAETCKIVTYTTWVPYNPPKPTYETTQYVHSTVTVVPVPTTTCYEKPSYEYAVPTPEVTTCPTTGVYTFPAKTITLTDTKTVCVGTTTVLPPGTHTYGYSTTVIPTSTTVTVPYATTSTKGGNTIYSTLTSTIYTCSGTYTYGGYTTTLTKTKTVEYPVLTTYCPATYTHPANTVTVTVTGTIYSCPYAVYTPAPKPQTHAPSAPTYAAPSKTKTYAPKPTKGSGGYSGDVSEGKKWAITYTQYNDDRSCKSGDQIEGDIKDIAHKGFRAIRVYAPNCNALQPISDACEKYGLKIILGVFIEKGDYGYADVYNQIQTLCTWKKWYLVELLVIGNEAVFGGTISSTDLAGLITSAREKVVASGYTGPITTSEVVGTLQNNPGLCSVIDVVGVNIQPFFNGGYAADAGEFLQSQLKIASDVCGKVSYCLEAGWPSAGLPIGNSIPGYGEQKAAIDSICAHESGRVVFNDYRDAKWKDGSMNGGVEQHFGCGHLFP